MLNLKQNKSMELDSETLENYTKYPNKIFLVSNIENANSLDISEQALAFVEKKNKNTYSEPIQIETLEERIFIVSTEKVNNEESKDGLRSAAYSVLQACNKAKLKNVLVVNNGVKNENAYAFLEGLYLSSYSFQKYKSEKKEFLQKLLIRNVTSFCRIINQILHTPFIHSPSYFYSLK